MKERRMTPFEVIGMRDRNRTTVVDLIGELAALIVSVTGTLLLALSFSSFFAP